MHKKFGAMLYRKGGDILTSLSWALGAQDISSDDIEDYGIQILPTTKRSDNRSQYCRMLFT